MDLGSFRLHAGVLQQYKNGSWRKAVGTVSNRGYEMFSVGKSRTTRQSLINKLSPKPRYKSGVSITKKLTVTLGVYRDVDRRRLVIDIVTAFIDERRDTLRTLVHSGDGDKVKTIVQDFARKIPECTLK